MNRAASQSSSSGWVGSRPWLPKSSGVAHEAAAEVHAPDAIDDDAGRERVLAIGEPAGEAEAIARLVRGERRQAARRLARDDVARRVVGAARQQVRRAAASRISSITMISGTSAMSRFSVARSVCSSPSAEMYGGYCAREEVLERAGIGRIAANACRATSAAVRRDVEDLQVVDQPVLEAAVAEARADA